MEFPTVTYFTLTQKNCFNSQIRCRASEKGFGDTHSTCKLRIFQGHRTLGSTFRPGPFRTALLCSELVAMLMYVNVTLSPVNQN